MLSFLGLVADADSLVLGTKLFFDQIHRLHTIGPEADTRAVFKHSEGASSQAANVKLTRQQNIAWLLRRE